MKPYVVIKVDNDLAENVIRLNRTAVNRGYDALVWLQEQEEFHPHDMGITKDTMIVYCDTEERAVHTMQYMANMYPQNKYMYCAAKQIMFREPGEPVVARVTEQGIMPV